MTKVNDWWIRRLHERRVIVRFAWQPVQINSHLTVWLESYSEEQVFTRVFSPPDGSGGYEDKWITSRLVEHNLFH